MTIEVEQRPRRRRLVGGAVTVAVLLVVAGLAFYVFGPRWSTNDVAMPPDDASPTEVVTAYLQALSSGDCATAKSLSVPDSRYEAARWCGDVESITLVDLGEPSVDEDPTSRGLPRTAHVVTVSTTIDVKWRPLRDDGTFFDGPTGWGYSLLQQPSGAWRVLGQGQG